MKNLIAIAALLAISASYSYGQSAEISPNGSRKSLIGSEKNFTGYVIIDPLYGASEHLPQTGGLITFAPGARSAWHTHPAGQMLIVT
jgi:quercetin dioxygenase-like cupin family protein